jgi:hypothetical protein
MYIGSANLTSSAWYKNIEVGRFFNEKEISDEVASDILAMFKVLDEYSTPLTKELLREMKLRQNAITSAMPIAKGFWSSPSFTKWEGLVNTGATSARSKRRADFLKEWHATLQDLRDIGEAVSKPTNRPSWVSASAPAGAQADLFLHAHYYQRTFNGRKANYAAFKADLG